MDPKNDYKKYQSKRFVMYSTHNVSGKALKHAKPLKQKVESRNCGGRCGYTGGVKAHK